MELFFQLFCAFVLIVFYSCYWAYKNNFIGNYNPKNKPIYSQAQIIKNDIIWKKSRDVLMSLSYRADPFINVDFLKATLSFFFKYKPDFESMELAAIWLFCKNDSVVMHVQNLMAQTFQNVPMKRKIDILSQVLTDLNKRYSFTKDYYTDSGYLIYSFESHFFTPEGLDILLKTIIAVFNIRRLNSVGKDFELTSLIAKYKNTTINNKNLFEIKGFINAIVWQEFRQDFFATNITALAVSTCLLGCQLVMSNADLLTGFVNQRDSLVQTKECSYNANLFAKTCSITGSNSFPSYKSHMQHQTQSQSGFTSRVIHFMRSLRWPRALTYTRQTKTRLQSSPKQVLSGKIAKRVIFVTTNDKFHRKAVIIDIVNNGDNITNITMGDPSPIDDKEILESVQNEDISIIFENKVEQELHSMGITTQDISLREQHSLKIQTYAGLRKEPLNPSTKEVVCTSSHLFSLLTRSASGLAENNDPTNFVWLQTCLDRHIHEEFDKPSNQFIKTGENDRDLFPLLRDIIQKNVDQRILPYWRNNNIKQLKYVKGGDMSSLYCQVAGAYIKHYSNLGITQIQNYWLNNLHIPQDETRHFFFMKQLNRVFYYLNLDMERYLNLFLEVTGRDDINFKSLQNNYDRLILQHKDAAKFFFEMKKNVLHRLNASASTSKNIESSDPMFREQLDKLETDIKTNYDYFYNTITEINKTVVKTKLNQKKYVKFKIQEVPTFEVIRAEVQQRIPMSNNDILQEVKNWQLNNVTKMNQTNWPHIDGA